MKYAVAAVGSPIATLATLQWGSASLVEVLWTIFGAVGIYLTWGNLTDARRDFEAVTEMNGRNLKQHQIMRILALGHYRNEIGRIIVFLVIALIGMIAMATPPIRYASPVTPVSAAITVGLFITCAVLVAMSALDRRQRRLLEVMDADEVRTPLRT